MNTRQHADAQQIRVERRRNLVLRQHFEAAQTLLKPLLGNQDNHNGTAFYRAMNKLQATFPDLTDSEIEALVAAVVRSVETRGGRR